MAGFSKLVIRVSPRALRWVRTSLFLDLDRLRATLPQRGRVLDVGCGYGHVLSCLAESRPDLEFLGIDLDRNAIDAATNAWPLPNLRFQLGSVESVESQRFDLVIVIDVIHHLPAGAEADFLTRIGRLVKDSGGVVLKDIPFSMRRLSVFLDTYVSRCPPRVRTDTELDAALTPHFIVGERSVERKFGVGHLYLFLRPRASESTAHA